MFDKERWDGVKTFFDAFRIPTLVIAAVVLFAWPQLLTDLVKRAGFRITGGELAGFKLVANDLDATAAQLKQVTSALADGNKLLSDIAGQANSADIKKRVEDFLKTARDLVQSGREAATAAADQAATAQAKVQALTSEAPSGDVPGSSLFVFGADTDVKSAIDEVRRAQQALAGSDATVALFRKGSFYRSVAIFPTATSRSERIKDIEKAVNRQGTAVSLATWCPAAKRQPDAIAGAVAAPLFQC